MLEPAREYVFVTVETVASYSFPEVPDGVRETLAESCVERPESRAAAASPRVRGSEKRRVSVLRRLSLFFFLFF